MKTLCVLMGILLSFAQNSWAHPIDTDPAYTIPVGSKLTLTADINILPNTSKKLLAYDCWFEYQTSVHDRVIKKGAVYEVKSVVHVRDQYYSDRYSFFMTFTSYKLLINCEPRQKLRLIGDIRGMLKPLGIDLELAVPVDF